MSDDKKKAKSSHLAPYKWQPGQSGNPGGRKKLPEEIMAIKHDTLQRAIEILHEKINDPEYMEARNATELVRLLETAFDRFGLPKVTKVESDVNMNIPVVDDEIMTKIEQEKNGRKD